MEIHAQCMKIHTRHSNVISTKSMSFLVLTTILAIALGSLMTEPVQVSATDTSSTYQGPELCKKCHETQYQEWSETAHAQAFDDPLFQEEWAPVSVVELFL